MENTPEITKINQSLEKVLRHHIFVKSPRNARLLKFLVEQAINGVDIKEHIIGVELFHNNYNPEKNDGRVRVYMFNLRKKLDEYYQEVVEGNDIVFEIEKGQYNVHFGVSDSKVDKVEETEFKSSLSKKNALIIAACVLVISFLVFLFYPRNKAYCWNDFFSSKGKNLCVIADHLMFEKSQGGGKWLPVRINGINSEYELTQYMSENNITDIRGSDYTMMTKMAPYAIHEIDAWFHAHDNKVEVRLESELRLEEARNNNIVYVGQFKTMNASKGLFLRDSKVFSIYNDGFLYDDGKRKIKYATSMIDGKRTEHAMVSFMPLENGHVALFLTSNNDIGTLATVRNFTDQEWLDEFFAQLPKGAKFFNAVFKVTGLRRTDMTCELVKLEVME